VLITNIYEEKIRQPLQVFFILTAVWGFTTTLLLGAGNPVLLQSAYTVGLVAGLATVVAWLWFCSAYTGAQYHRNRSIQALVLGASTIIVLVKITNPIHGGYFRPQIVDEPFVHFAPEVGIAYWAVTAIAYLGAAIGLFMLFEMYYQARFGTMKIGALTALTGLPIIPKVAVVVWPDTLLLLYYEPIGVALFGIGIVAVAKDSFLSVRTPARTQLADHLDDAVVIIDQSDRIVDYNDIALQLFESLDDSVGAPLSERVPLLCEQGDDGASIEIESNDETRYYSVAVQEVRLGQSLVGKAFVLSDQTSLERQRQQLERQAEHIENLTAGIAHELRNPLTVIRGNIEHLAANKPQFDSEEPGDKPATPSGRALVAAENIEDIVNDLMTVLTYSKPVTETEMLDVSELMDHAVSTDTLDHLVIECVDCGQIKGERIRCIELFQYLLRLHDQQGAETITVTGDANKLQIRSDGDALSKSTRSELFEYDPQSWNGEQMVLTNAWTLAKMHGWSLNIDTDIDGLSTSIEDL
jgi:signal transduction histidine kinase